MSGCLGLGWEEGLTEDGMRDAIEADVNVLMVADCSDSCTTLYIY